MEKDNDDDEEDENDNENHSKAQTVPSDLVASQLEQYRYDQMIMKDYNQYN